MQARRFFFRSLAKKTSQLGREVPGHRYISLRGLRKLEDRRLEEIVPVFSENADWKIGAARIHRWDDASSSWVLFRELKPTESMVVRMILASIPLSEIAVRLAAVSDLPHEEAWDAVKSIFLECAEGGFCHPSQPPDPEDGEE